MGAELEFVNIAACFFEVRKIKKRFL